MKPIPRKDFLEKVKELGKEYTEDDEALHIATDRLMESALIHLGYKEGILEIRKTVRWYA